jgi:Fe-S oxidoreductase
VLAHGGSISGEHGDGQARAALLPKMFGPELMQAFREFKALWDPLNKMNPGKLVDPVAVYEPHENLRLGAGYQSDKIETYFQFPEDKGSFAEATLRCVGVGACRKQSPGTMCPSYMATQEERHSTRGRAHLLWELLEGNVMDRDWGNEQVREALDLCLSCKACKSECPVNVDVATYKAEFLAHYHEQHPHPLRDYAFGFMDRWAHLASAIPRVTTRLANLPLQLPGVSSVIKQLLGVAAQRRLPQFAPRSYQSSVKSEIGRAAQSTVLLWPDTWNNYYHPHVLASAREVLVSAGFTPHTPRQHVCCGRPLYDFGFLDEARSYLEKILREFAPFIDAGTAFVFLEPSCASVFRDELLNFFPTDERAKRLGEQTLLLSEFLVRKAPGYTPPSLAGQRIVLHGHCHHKSLFKMKDELTILRATGAEVELLDAGCCGMAGPFGFEKEKYEVSQALGERVLLPAVRDAAPETLLVTDGFSCREQIAQNTDRRALHFVEAICHRFGPGSFKR